MDFKRTYIVAELSANHNHDFDLAVRTVEAMAAAGADAVKVQTYKAESLTMNIENDYFGAYKTGIWKGLKPFDLYQQGSMPYEWQPKLQTIAAGLGMDFFSTPFDAEGVDFLASMNIPLYKVASFEINDIPLIKRIAQQGKPVIISTGVAEEQDVRLALEACHSVGNRDVVLLKCTSSYPAPLEKANLRMIPRMREEFGVPVGISDHTMGAVVPMAAVAMGACMVEKHFILDRSLGGPDSSFSMEPAEFKAMVEGVRDVEKALGVPEFQITDKGRHARRALYATQDIHPGDVFTSENIHSYRPGLGLSPAYYEQVLGKESRRFIPRGNPLTSDDL